MTDHSDNAGRRLAAAIDASGVPLTFDEVTRFHVRREEEEARNEAWVASNPAIKQILQDFLAAVLRDKPTDVKAYAATHFMRYSEGEISEGEEKTDESS